MNEKRGGSIENIFSNPIFFLIAIIVVFAAIYYFFGSNKEGKTGNLTSTYAENEEWKNSEDAKGPADAKVTIVEYGDYQCPACASAHSIVNKVMEEYSGKVRLIYRHFPLPQHPFALKATVSAECAGEQGKFWEMHDKLYDNQQDINTDNFFKFAGDVGLDSNKFKACFDGNGYMGKINDDQNKGENDNLKHTPTFFVNGAELGSFGLEDFKKAIDSELNK
ncbi:MAG: thioredoxin domain-containing protein [Minisyncoccia bacterium]